NLAGVRTERFSNNRRSFARGSRSSTAAVSESRKQLHNLRHVAGRGPPVDEAESQGHAAMQARGRQDGPARGPHLLHQRQIATIQLFFIPFFAAPGSKSKTAHAQLPRMQNLKAARPLQ